MLIATAAARADAPLSQGFEDGAPAWSATGMWHTQADPQTVSVVPAIADKLVTLPDGGYLPVAPEGSHVAWFGEAATGTYCGSDFASIKQTPQDGCTSTHVEHGALASPSFSLVGHSTAYLVFRAWWEIEAVNADISDLMRVEYSTDGGATWTPAGSLNPLDPSWGGRPQSYSDGGARESGSWRTYGADLSGAVGQSDVRVRFVFDTVDRLRNGFRGLLVDGVAIVDGLGATISEPQAASFTDAPPSLSVTDVRLSQGSDGTWSVQFVINSSSPVTHAVGVDWALHGHSGAPVASGHVTLPPGQTQATVTTTVSGTDAPYTATLANPSGATIAPGGSSATTPGGALPLVGLDSVGAAAAGDGAVAVSIAVKLSEPSGAPVSVDYGLTGSDGVAAARGTLTIPAGELTAATTVTVSSEHAPYTVGLSNARGAILDPASASASTSPLAGIASVSGQGSQLVLGVRQGAGPDLNKTFLLTALSGTVRYHKPGGSYATLPSGAIVLPLGSVVDATGGHALITVESDAQGTLQQVEIWEGKAGVFQVGVPAVAELRLAGGDFSSCPTGAQARRHARRSGSTVLRHLWASGKGRFRTKGRFASATVRGTKWLTEDLCLATRITVAEGVVAVYDFRRKQTTAVPAGQQITVGALQSARYRNRRGVHAPRLSRA